jgi:ketosteroid isomerase-like protein
MTANPNEQATDAVNRTAQEMLAALLAKDSSKVNTYYAADAVIATPGRPAAKDGRAVSKAIRDDTEDSNFTMSLSNEKTEVAGSGDLGYRRGTFKITYTNPQTKQAEILYSFDRSNGVTWIIFSSALNKQLTCVVASNR